MRQSHLNQLPPGLEDLSSEQVEAVQRYRVLVQSNRTAGRRKRYLPQINATFGHLTTEAREALADAMYRSAQSEIMRRTWRTRNTEPAT